MTVTRRAKPEDAFQASVVLQRSITELCHADHGGDQKRLDRWLANKTPENFKAWIENPEVIVFVAENGKTIVGVGACSLKGDVILNYVSPDFRFQGVSTLLLEALEKHLLECGHRNARLSSTQTAVVFYQSRGWKVTKPSKAETSPDEIRMTKSLAVEDAAIPPSR